VVDKDSPPLCSRLAVISRISEDEVIVKDRQSHTLPWGAGVYIRLAESYITRSPEERDAALTHLQKHLTVRAHTDPFYTSRPAAASISYLNISRISRHGPDGKERLLYFDVESPDEAHRFDGTFAVVHTAFAGAPTRNSPLRMSAL